MQSHVFQSIIEITRNRDLDSLDVGFVKALGELFSTRSVTLFRLSKPDDIDSLQEILHLRRGNDDRQEMIESWASESRVLELNEPLKLCINGSETVSGVDPDGHYMLLPIVSAGKLRAVVRTYSAKALDSMIVTLHGLTKIYGNYMSVLHDSERDKLTGLLNRRTFDDKLRRMLVSQRRSKNQVPELPDCAERRLQETDTPLSAWLGVLDIDHFKRINDQWGHVYGDEILLRLAQKMRQTFRKVDLLFRVGGEEFVIVLAPQTQATAKMCFERFRQAVADSGLLHDGITVSIGYVGLGEADYPPHAFDLADRALYHAKQNGRNQTCSYEQLVAQGQLVPEDYQGGSIELF